MPLLINVGLDRKARKDLQSAGVAINLAAELDMGLLADPPRLQQEIEKVYMQAEAALDKEVQAMFVCGTTQRRSESPQEVQHGPGQGGRGVRHEPLPHPLGARSPSARHAAGILNTRRPLRRIQRRAELAPHGGQHTPPL